MNGLANAILTLLLSWLRIIVNRLWSLLNSEGGNQFFAFLADHWLAILLVLGVGGFALDKLVYLIRWRPFWVRRRRREPEDFSPWPEPQEYHNAYAPPAAVPTYADPQPAQQADMLFDQEAQAQPYWDHQGYEVANDPVSTQTAVYSHPAADRSAYRPPMEDIDPVFDEQAAWSGSDQLVGDPAYGQPNGYAPSPVTDQYQQDVHAGFARPVPPQQLYTPTQQPTNEPMIPSEAQPVHPGLDVDLLRRNMGLGYGEDGADPYPTNTEQPIAVSFTPFTQQAEVEQPAKKNRNPFLNLMRLVGDDAAKPSIHDLQSTVDVREAFREPVYPKPLYRNEDDPT